MKAQIILTIRNRACLKMWTVKLNKRILEIREEVKILLNLSPKKEKTSLITFTLNSNQKKIEINKIDLPLRQIVSANNFLLQHKRSLFNKK